jgi:hypothetical protein
MERARRRQYTERDGIRAEVSTVWAMRSGVRAPQAPQREPDHAGEGEQQAHPRRAADIDGPQDHRRERERHDEAGVSP